eukprot:m.352903 g.352903  ORF g.352903 m.352903 type:complete len:323 (+) comp27988_c0_seq3:193-1161(+)
MVDRPVLVGIITLARSGSTLFTDLLCTNRSSIFGLYEPFHDAPAMVHSSVTPGVPSASIPSAVHSPPPWGALYDCSFAHDNRTLQAVAWRGLGRRRLADQLDDFSVWRTPKERARFRYGLDGIDQARYAPAIHQMCTQSTVRVVKTIRFSGNVKSLLATWAKWTENDGRATGDGAPAAPNLKIIHLIRDPLAVARSTVKFTRQGRWDGLTAVNEQVQLVCRSSSRIARWLAATVPAHAQLRVRYEDVLSHPVSTVARVFRFIGVPFDEEAAAQVKRTLGHTQGPKSRLTSADEAAVNNETAITPETRAMCEHMHSLAGYVLS